MNNKIKKVILLFKTHLDVGFTDYSKNVIEHYVNEYIPKSIALAKQLRDSGRDERFVWTVGSWLVKHYFDVCSDAERRIMEDAIACGDISYHALPFTMHTEIMDESLFNYGLSIAQELDKKFGKNTVAGKYTDVPGHTKAIIPHLVKAGIRFLHIGVNPASMPPDVPDVFRWKYDDDEIVVMYNKGYYGEAAQLPYTDTVVWFAHTNDNCGPQDAEEIIRIYEKIRSEYPNAEIVASDLNEVYKELKPVESMLPVVTQEIGDTWIHGAGTDPKKMSQYRAMLRLLPELSESDKKAAENYLICVPEHTWGMNEQIYLRDYDNFSKEELKRCCETDKYKKFMSSWDEQRKYVTDACEALSDNGKAKARPLLDEYKQMPPELDKYELISDIKNIKIGDYNISLNSDGSLGKLLRKENVIFTENDCIGKFVYEVFGSENYAHFQKQYLTHRFDWAIDDFGKNGCEKVLTSKKSYNTAVGNVYKNEKEMLVELLPAFEACEKFGCPRKIYMSVVFNANDIQFDFSLFCKDANRLGEAVWIGFRTNFSSCRIRKLGKWIDTNDVVSNGGRTLHATDFGVRLDECTEIQSIDTALVAAGRPSLLNFSNNLPDYKQGVWFNLYNNVWGTNFPMWYNENMRFRFIIRF